MKNTIKKCYVMVPFHLSGIQKGIQAGHAQVELVLKTKNKQVLDWAENHKTTIVLDGGTVPMIDDFKGILENQGKDYHHFFEPDLGISTALAFIVDESEDLLLQAYLKQYKLASN